MIVATRDRPAALRRCLAALLEGDRRPRQVVVVNQGRRHLAPVGLPGAPGVEVVVIDDPGRGLSRARNLGLAAARQPLVAVLDDDCVPSRGWLAAIVTELTGPAPPEVVCGPVLPRPPGGGRLHAVSSRRSLAAADHTGRALPWRAGTGGNMGARTELIRRLGGWDTRLGAGSDAGAGEDIDLLYRLLRARARIRYSPEQLVEHDRVDAVRRRATRWSYGRGLGAFVGLRLRARDPHAPRLLVAWSAQRLALLARALTRGHRTAATEEAIVLVSTARGVIHGIRAGAGGRR